MFCICSELKRKAKSVSNYSAKIELLGSYDPQKQLIIKDPYYVSSVLVGVGARPFKFGDES